MFTFIHLSRRTETRRVEYFPFLCTFIPSLLQSASSPLAGISSCEWRKEEKKLRCANEKIFAFNYLLRIKDASDEKRQKWSPLKALSIQRDSVYKIHRELFSGGRRFLIEIEVSLLLWDKNVLRFWVRINFFWCLSLLSSERTFLFWRTKFRLKISPTQRL